MAIEQPRTTTAWTKMQIPRNFSEILFAIIITFRPCLKKGNTQAVSANFLRRLSVTLLLYSIPHFMAMYLSQAMAVKWNKDDKDMRNIMGFVTRESNVQICSKETWLSIKTTVVADSGIVIAPVRRSVKAMLHSKMFDCFFSSLRFFKATITVALRKVMIGEAIDVMNTKIQGKVVWVKSQMMLGSFWHKKTDLLAEVES